MKKTIALLLVSVMIISLAACSININTGSSSENNNNNTPSSQAESMTEKSASSAASSKSSSSKSSSSKSSSSAASSKASSSAGNSSAHMSKDEFEKFLSSYVDLSHYDQDQTLGEDKCLKYIIKREYRPEYTTSKDVHMLSEEAIELNGNDKITAGMSVPDVLAKGWDFKSSTLKTRKLEPNSGIEADFVKSGKEIKLKLKNTGNSAVESSKTTVDSFSVSLYGSKGSKLDTAPNFVFDGKITNSSGMKEVFDAYGEPRQFFYSYNNGSQAPYIDVVFIDAGEKELQLHVCFSEDGKNIYYFYTVKS